MNKNRLFLTVAFASLLTACAAPPATMSELRQRIASTCDSRSCQDSAVEVINQVFLDQVQQHGTGCIAHRFEEQDDHMRTLRLPDARHYQVRVIKFNPTQQALSVRNTTERRYQMLLRTYRQQYSQLGMSQTRHQEWMMPPYQNICGNNPTLMVTADEALFAPPFAPKLHADDAAALASNTLLLVVERRR